MRINSVGGRLLATAVSALLLSGLAIGSGLGVGAAAAAPAADPGNKPVAADQSNQPTTAVQAKLAWLEAIRQQESYGERVKGAQVALDQAQIRAVAAGRALAAADARVAAFGPALQAAQRRVDTAQQQVDELTAASLRGGQLGSLSALFTAGDADDFLDRAMAIDQVASDAQHTRQEAAAARESLEQQQRDAAVARAAAAKAKQDADRAVAAATTARQAVDAGKVELAAKITAYQAAYAKLSAADRSDPGTNMGDYYAAQADRERSGVQHFVKGSVDDPTSAAFAARAAKEAPTPQAAIAVLAALSRQGLPYVWATDGPNTFDCSGLTKWAWKQAGVTIPPVSYEQANLTPVPLDKLEPGDLITYYSPVSHVGMYVGHGKVVHAAIEGVPIKVVDLHAAGPDPSGHRPKY